MKRLVKANLFTELDEEQQNTLINLEFDNRVLDQYWIEELWSTVKEEFYRIFDKLKFLEWDDVELEDKYGEGYFTVGLNSYTNEKETDDFASLCAFCGVTLTNDEIEAIETLYNYPTFVIQQKAQNYTLLSSIAELNADVEDIIDYELDEDVVRSAEKKLDIMFERFCDLFYDKMQELKKFAENADDEIFGEEALYNYWSECDDATVQTYLDGLE